MPDFPANLRVILPAALLVLGACARTPEPVAEPAAAPVAQAAPAAPASECTPPPVATPAAPDAPKPQVPALVIETFTGDCFDLSKQRGHWVVVNFWATWCTPCLKEIPDLAAFDAKRDDVQVIGLSYDGEITREEMTAFLADHPIPYPIAIVDVTAPPADFETPKALPMTVLIAPDGKRAREVYAPVTGADLEKWIADYGTAPADAKAPPTP